MMSLSDCLPTVRLTFGRSTGTNIIQLVLMDRILADPSYARDDLLHVIERGRRTRVLPEISCIVIVTCERRG